MTTTVLVLVGISTWIVLSFPIALVLAQVLRRRSAELPDAGPDELGATNEHELVG